MRIKRRVKNYHYCELPIASYSCLPRLAPDSNKIIKKFRSFRKLFLVANRNFRTADVFRSHGSIVEERRRHVRMSKWYVIHPFSDYCFFLEIVMCILWAIAFAKDSFLIAYVEDLHRDYIFHSFFSALDLVTFLLSLSFFLIGYQNERTKEIVLDSRSILLHYLTGYFFPDILGAAPYALGELMGLPSEIVFHLEYLRVVRFMRIRTMLVYFKQITKLLNVSTFLHKILCFSVIAIYMVHWCTCAYYVLTDTKEISLTNSAANVNFHPNNSKYSSFMKYTMTLYLIICHMYNVEITYMMSTDHLQQLFLSFIMILGLVYYCLVIGTVLEMAKCSNSSESKYEEIVSQLKKFSELKKLPLELRNRLLRFYELRFQHHYFKESAIYSLLPTKLNSELKLFNCSYLIEKVPVFRLLPQAAIEQIVENLDLEYYMENDILATTNTPCEGLFFILHGTVAFTLPNGVELAHYNDGDFFGDQSILFGNGRNICNAIATTPCEMYRLSIPNFDMICRHHPKLKALCQERAALNRDLFSPKKEPEAVTLINQLRKGLILQRPKRRY